MRGRMGKLGIFMLTLVFAIGAMGAAFASWTDTVVIEGEVTTGSLGYEVCEFSETWVYKVVEADSNYGPIGTLVNSGVPLDDATLLYIASADWEGQVPGTPPDGCIAGANQSYNVTFDNLFPCPDFCADIVIHYVGSVPARLSPETVIPEGEDYDWLRNLWGTESFYMEAYRGSMNDTTGEIDWEDTPVDLEGLQLEYCDYVKIWWCIHIPQDNTLMNQRASFTTTIDMVQWNEYAPPAL